MPGIPSMVSLVPPMNNAYWLGQPAGQSAAILYSSAANAVVPQTNPSYVAWLATYGRPWPWPKDQTGAITTAALDAILTSYGLPVTGLTPLTRAELIAYASGKATALRGVSRTYTLGSAVTIACDARTATGADLAGLNFWGNANPSATTTWVDDSGVTTVITGAEAMALAAGVVAYGQSVYAVLASACAGIASGAITITAEIDALSWPT